MSEPRRIVPDNSVLVEALFGSEKGLRLKRASQFLTAALNRSIICLAPDTLIVEFIKVAFDFRGGKREHSATPDEIDAQIELFLSIKIAYIPSRKIARRALHHCRANQLSPTDSWYLAAAEESSAELWISHDQKDGFTANARNVYGKVFTLERNDFYKAARQRR
jgi:predicted nucleic acid-binding protein